MSAYVARELERAAKIRAARAAAQATETLDEAQAALDEAQARYNDYPCSRNAYRIAEARDRVEAAKARGRRKLQSLAEWAATPSGQEYMDQAPDGDLLREIGEHDAARVAPRHPEQPYYYGRQFRSAE